MIRKFLVIIACLIFQVGDCNQNAIVCASPLLSWQQIPLIGPHITGEKLLTQFENSNTDVMDQLNHHLSLLGILLGFGRYNSLLFEKKEGLTDTLENPLYNSAFN